MVELKSTVTESVITRGIQRKIWAGRKIESMKIGQWKLCLSDRNLKKIEKTLSESKGHVRRQSIYALESWKKKK